MLYHTGHMGGVPNQSVQMRHRSKLHWKRLKIVVRVLVRVRGGVLNHETHYASGAQCQRWLQAQLVFSAKSNSSRKFFLLEVVGSSVPHPMPSVVRRVRTLWASECMALLSESQMNLLNVPAHVAALVELLWTWSDNTCCLTLRRLCQKRAYLKTLHTNMSVLGTVVNVYLK